MFKNEKLMLFMYLIFMYKRINYIVSHAEYYTLQILTKKEK